MTTSSSRAAHSLERLVFFSDAVFAIAITLLVLEIEVPRLKLSASSAQFGQALFALEPSFFAFVLSFLVIGRFWMGHHELFGKLDRYSPRLVFPNLMFLMAVVFMPFATAFMGGNLGHFVPSPLNNVTLSATAMLDWNLTRFSASAGIISANVGRSETRHSIILSAATVLTTGLTWWRPQFSQAEMLTIPIGFALLRRHERAGDQR